VLLPSEQGLLHRLPDVTLELVDHWPTSLDTIEGCGGDWLPIQVNFIDIAVPIGIGWDQGYGQREQVGFFLL
jgi:hypothetical protein